MKRLADQPLLAEIARQDQVPEVREAAAALLVQVKQLEATAQRASELDLALVSEQERSMQLEKRAMEAEHMAEQSTRRFEDMARKLGEIAGLASQLGNGKR